VFLSHFVDDSSVATPQRSQRFVHQGEVGAKKEELIIFLNSYSKKVKINSFLYSKGSVIRIIMFKILFE